MAKHPQGPSDISVRAFVEAVGSAEEAHGTVSTAAVAAGLGSSLLLMVATLPQTRSDSADDRTKLIEAATVLTDVQQQLIETIETETAVKLFTARNMPQASDAQRSERQAAIQVALGASADVPLEVMRLCARGLRLAATVAAHSARPASADVQLGVALLQAGFDGSRSNLEGKLRARCKINRTRVAPSGAAPPGAEPSPVTSASGRAPGGAARRQDPLSG